MQVIILDNVGVMLVRKQELADSQQTDLLNNSLIDIKELQAPFIVYCFNFLPF